MDISNKQIIFDFTEESKQLKSKSLVLSGVSLFIGLTETLPEKIAILGLDLSQNQTISGWFILAVSSYVFIKFIIVSTLEITHHSLPFIIKYKIKNTVGDTLGLTADECHESYSSCDNSDEEAIGTPSGELQEITRKNKHISGRYKFWYVKLHNLTTYAVDLLFPVILYAISANCLFSFLVE